MHYSPTKPSWNKEKNAQLEVLKIIYFFQNLPPQACVDGNNLKFRWFQNATMAAVKYLLSRFGKMPF